jgi:hypothetical protein
LASHRVLSAQDCTSGTGTQPPPAAHLHQPRHDLILLQVGAPRLRLPDRAQQVAARRQLGDEVGGAPVFVQGLKPGLGCGGVCAVQPCRDA